MSVSVSREQVIRCLRDAGWRYSQRGKRTEIWRKSNNAQRVSLPLRDFLPEGMVRLVLSQAGFARSQIDDFLLHAVKNSC